MPQDNDESSITVKIPVPRFFKKSKKGNLIHSRSFHAKNSSATETSHFGLKNKTNNFKIKLIYIILSLLFFLMFVGFSLIVKENILNKFDFDTTVRIQQKVPVRFDRFLSFLSFLGNAESVTIILTLLLIFRRKIKGIFILGIFGAAHAVEIIGKNFLDHPGPPRFMLRSLASDFPQFTIFTPGSYPSGHSMRMIFVTIIMFAIIYASRKISRNIKMFLYCIILLYAFLMLFSRISLGEHWATDVIAGSFLGASFGFLSLLFL